MAELQRVVAGERHVHAVGTGHSFSPVADTRGALVSVADLPETFEVTPEGDAVSVSAGITFAALAPQMEAAGLALHNLGSLPHISLAGAFSTGTHGSGDRLPCMAAAVREVELVTATGDLLVLDRGDPDFAGVLPSLGALGVVTRMTLDTQPSYAVAQTVWQGVDVSTGLGDLDALMATAYSVSVFTTLSPHDFGDLWVKRRMDEPEADLSRWGGHKAAQALRPVPGGDATGCTLQGGVAGPWYERLPHFTPDQPPSSSGAEVQSEYYVSRVDGPAAAAAVWELGAELAPALQICELRTVAGDGLWLSPACEQGLLGIHFTWQPDVAAVESACRTVEEALAPFEPVPHWGKVSWLDPAVVAARFPRLPDARRLVARLDPDNVFGNDVTDVYLRGV
jgi:xylitol oxidase